MKAVIKTLALLAVPTLTWAQVPVDDDGNVIGKSVSQADVMPLGEEGIPLLDSGELQELVGPIALYPDDLLAIVLPASAYPLQIVEAARFLEAYEEDPTLTPNSEWDDSVVALINYPEVIELLNSDLDWTWRLGDAVVAQQTDVVAAVESFRDIAYAAGNLKSDSYQTVSNDEGVIEISPASEDVIYVPYYEPARVVVYQPRPAYYYYPRPRPVYYYPYAPSHHFSHGYFWGVTTAFTIGWYSDSLHVYHHSYRGHPYYGRSYWNDYWYRRPSINIYNTNYSRHTNVTVNRYRHGDRWRANETRRQRNHEGYRDAREDRGERYRDRARTQASQPVVKQGRRYEPITFRERDNRRASQSRDDTRRAQPATRTATVTRTGTTRRGQAANVRNTQQEQPARNRESRRQQTHREQPAQNRESRRQQTRREQPAQNRESRRQQTRREQPAQNRESRRQQTRREQPAQNRETRRQQTRREQPAERQQTRREQPARSNETRRSQPTQARETKREAPARQQRSSGNTKNRGKQRERRR